MEGEVEHRFRYVNGLPLNESNPDVLVNFLHYEQKNKKGTKTFTWVTSLEINEANVYDIMRGGRARWKVENETFNTQKTKDTILSTIMGMGTKICQLC